MVPTSIKSRISISYKNHVKFWFDGHSWCTGIYDSFHRSSTLVESSDGSVFEFESRVILEWDYS